jgi:hypothetical protein
MKNSIFSRILVMVAAIPVVVGRFFVAAFAPYSTVDKPSMARLIGSKQGGFVLLGRTYMGYASGTIVELPASTEAALIAAGQAVTSAGPPTAGAVSTTANSGCVTFAAAAASLVVTNPNVTVQSIVVAYINQAAADATMLDIVRIVPAAGSFTIHANAAATAATLVKWAIVNPNGSLSAPI